MNEDRNLLDDEALAAEIPPPGVERRRGPRFSLLSGTLILSLLALGGGFLIVNWILMPSLTRQGVEVVVPELVGLSEREAERILADENLRLSKISEQWSADVPRGYIASQDPLVGTLVKRGRRISVIVSLGAQGTSVPPLAGESARQAEILLEGLGLHVGRRAHAYSDEVGRDLVIGSDPPAETLVNQESVVDLLVSLGPPPPSYVLPDLVGREAETVASVLREEGFFVLLRKGGPSQRDGLVAAQVPTPGARVAPRDTITLLYHK